jgi:predicted DNA-binding transcriptional regulator AlpA
LHRCDALTTVERMNKQSADMPGDAVVQLVDRAKVRELTGLRDSAIYEKMKGDFPRAYLIGRRHVRWKLHEVQAWINSRPQAPLKQAGVAPEGRGQKVAA